MPHYICDAQFSASCTEAYKAKNYAPMTPGYEGCLLNVYVLHFSFKFVLRTVVHNPVQFVHLHCMFLGCIAQWVHCVSCVHVKMTWMQNMSFILTQTFATSWCSVCHACTDDPIGLHPSDTLTTLYMYIGGCTLGCTLGCIPLTLWPVQCIARCTPAYKANASLTLWPHFFFQRRWAPEKVDLTDDSPALSQTAVVHCNKSTMKHWNTVTLDSNNATMQQWNTVTLQHCNTVALHCSITWLMTALHYIHKTADCGALHCKNVLGTVQMYLTL